MTSSVPPETAVHHRAEPSPIGAPSPDARWLRIRAAAAIGLALLVPVALFPPGGDAMLYFESGQKILRDGAVHYRDIVDVKPPLIYHLHALAGVLFGSTTASFRILDLLLQLVTTVAVARLVSLRIGRREGLIAGCLYAVMYVAQSYNGTAITESYVGLFAVPMIALQLGRRTARSMLAIGGLAGALFLLKFSLATPLAVAICAELALFDAPAKRRFRNAALIAGGFVAVAALLPLYLTLGDAWTGFAEMNAFLAGYVRSQSQGTAAAVQQALIAIPEYFADGFSLSMLLLCAFGAAASLGERARSLGDRERLLAIAAMNMLLMVAGVVIEGKYRAFHFSRIIPFATILAATGATLLVARVRAHRPFGAYERIAIAALLVIALIFSPLPRYLRHAAAAVIWTARGAEGFDAAYYREELGYSFVELERIGERIGSRRADGDELFVSSSVAGLVYAFADERPRTRVYHSAFLIAPYAPRVWREQTRAYLLARQPRFIVGHRRDSMMEMTGSPMSSAELLRALPGVDSLLRAAYDTALVTHHFELYERRRP